MISFKRFKHAPNPIRGYPFIGPGKNVLLRSILGKISHIPLLLTVGWHFPINSMIFTRNNNSFYRLDKPIYVNTSM